VGLFGDEPFVAIECQSKLSFGVVEKAFLEEGLEKVLEIFLLVRIVGLHEFLTVQDGGILQVQIEKCDPFVSFHLFEVRV